MKKFSFLFSVMAIMMLSSCSSMLPQFAQKTYVLDYQAASKGKVFLTEANSVSFEYEPIASIVVTSTDGMVKTPKVSKDYGNDNYNDSGTKISYKDEWQTATYAQSLDRAVESCLSMGGDGIINITFSLNYGSNGAVIGNTLRGMVIRRK